MGGGLVKAMELEILIDHIDVTLTYAVFFLSFLNRAEATN